MGAPARAWVALTIAVVLAGDAFGGAARTRGSGDCPVIISEIMVNPNGTESAREFVELFNRATYAVDLSGYTVGDTTELDQLIAVSSGLVLNPGSFALILDPSYFSVNEPYAGIPPEALVVTIGDAAFGQGGLVNSRANTVLLRSPEGCEVRVSYPPASVLAGFSLEKMDLTGADATENWTTSAVQEGTPGRANSRRRAACDISLPRSSITPDTIRPPGQARIAFELVNEGTDSVAAFQVHFFVDMNGDSALGDHEESITVWQMPPLQAGETRSVAETVQITGPFAGIPMLRAVVPGEEDATDNAMAIRCVIGLPEHAFVINEIMAHPADGEGQWVELLNRSSQPLPLFGSVLKTASGASSISYSGVVPTGDYIVVAEHVDMVRGRYGISSPVLATSRSFPYLSRSASSSRRVFLCDATGDTVGLAAYPVPEPGKSLERLSPDADGAVISSWVPSWAPAGATPGLRNAVSMPPPQDFVCSVDPIPATDTVGIRITAPEHGSFVTLRVYDMAGREVRKLLDGVRVPAESSSRWDGNDNNGRAVPTGVYVLHIEVVAPVSGNRFAKAQPIVIARRR